MTAGRISAAFMPTAFIGRFGVRMGSRLVRPRPWQLVLERRGLGGLAFGSRLRLRRLRRHPAVLLVLLPKPGRVLPLCQPVLLGLAAGSGKLSLPFTSVQSPGNSGRFDSKGGTLLHDRGVTMFSFHHLKPWLLAIMVVAGSVPAALAARPDASATAAAPNPGMARVWFLRPSSFALEVAGAEPTLYANGTPLGAIAANTEFYRDLAPGTYRFTVQPYGLPTEQAATLQLTPGSQSYLEVQWAATWQEGYPSGSGLESHSFFVLPMSPQLAQAWLPTLHNLGAD